MSYWGISTTKKTGPTWWLNGGRSASLTNNTVDLASQISGGKQTTKWSGAVNPIPQEDRKRNIEMPPELMEKLKQDRLNAIEQGFFANNDKERRQALANEQLKGINKKVEKEIQQNLIHDFKNFLLGEGLPEDYARVGWWPTDDKGLLVADKPAALQTGRVVSRHPSVLNWLEKEIDEQVKYKRDLTKLKLRAAAPGNMSLDELWKVYKFLNLGMAPEEEIANENFVRPATDIAIAPPELSPPALPPITPSSQTTKQAKEEKISKQIEAVTFLDPSISDIQLGDLPSDEKEKMKEAQKAFDTKANAQSLALAKWEWEQREDANSAGTQEAAAEYWKLEEEKTKAAEHRESVQQTPPTHLKHTPHHKRTRNPDSSPPTAIVSPSVFATPVPDKGKAVVGTPTKNASSTATIPDTIKGRREALQAAKAAKQAEKENKKEKKEQQQLDSVRRLLKGKHEAQKRVVPKSPSFNF